MQPNAKPRLKYPSYMALSERALRDKLQAKGWPRTLAQEIIDIVNQQKTARANSQRRRSMVESEWQHLIDPLMAERKRVQVALNYRKNDEAAEAVAVGHDVPPNDRDTARQTAYEAYHALLTTLLQRFRTALKQDFTPNELANELRDAGKAHLAPPVHLRSRAQHWTDWVSDRKKDQIMLLFSNIPHRAKARTKTPFTRDIPTEEGESNGD